MIKIAICDDEKEIVTQISNLIKSYFENKPAEYSVHPFTKAEDFLNSNLSVYDIVFMDIKINEDNGLDLAREVKLQNSSAVIILVSQFHEYLPAGYRVKAFRYILKPDLNKVFKEDMDSALQELNISEGFFEYRVYNDIYRIKYDDIIYFESKYPKIYINGTDSHAQTCFNGNIDDIFPLLDSDVFIRTGKSFVINAHHTKKISNSKAFMNNSIEINVSRDYVEQARSNLLRIKRGKQWNI